MDREAEEHDLEIIPAIERMAAEHEPLADDEIA
jgi:hypothetical protein